MPTHHELLIEKLRDEDVDIDTLDHGDVCELAYCLAAERDEAILAACTENLNFGMERVAARASCDILIAERDEARRREEAAELALMRGNDRLVEARLELAAMRDERDEARRLAEQWRNEFGTVCGIGGRYKLPWEVEDAK